MATTSEANSNEANSKQQASRSACVRKADTQQHWRKYYRAQMAAAAAGRQDTQLLDVPSTCLVSLRPPPPRGQCSALTADVGEAPCPHSKDGRENMWVSLSDEGCDLEISRNG